MADPSKPVAPPWDARWRDVGRGAGPWDAFWQENRGRELPDGAWLEAFAPVGPYGGVGEFDGPLDAMLQRARHILRREATIGRARRVSGKARIGRDELQVRRERLRGHVEALAVEAEGLIPTRRRSPDERALRGHLKTLRRAVEKGRYETEHEATIRSRLATIYHEAADAAGLIEAMARTAAQGIDPGSRLDLLTPEELAEAHDPDAPAVVGRLTRLLRLGDALRASRAEAASLLIGMPLPQAEPAPVDLDQAAARVRAVEALLALDPTARPDLLTEADIDRALGMAASPPPAVQAPGRGPHERGRGRWLAAHLMGLAVGLGVQPTRNEVNAENSACDRVSEVRKRLLEEVHHPSAVAMITEMPVGFDGMKRLWRSRRLDPLIRDTAAAGEALGGRLRLR